MILKFIIYYGSIKDLFLNQSIKYYYQFRDLLLYNTNI